MASPILTIGSFCTGIGWLDEGVKAGCEHFGWRALSALLCEWDAYAAATLLARMEEASLEPAFVFPDGMRAFDPRPFAGLVDIAVAGLPCQPYSSAGKGLGNADHRSFGRAKRGPLAQFIRILRTLRPAVVFLENVPTWVTRGWFRPFGEELCRLGYTLESPVFITAEAVGASHKRERVFIMAHNPLARGWLLPKPNGRNNAADTRWCGSPVGHAASAGGQLLGGSNTETGGSGAGKVRRRGVRRQQRPAISEQLADAQCDGWGQGTTTICGRESELAVSSLLAPGPCADWRPIPEHLWPSIEPGFRLLVDGEPLALDEGRTNQLRCSGNGCVALQAAVAFIELMRRLAR